VLLALSAGVLIGRALERNDEESSGSNDTTTTSEVTSTSSSSTSVAETTTTVVSVPSLTASPTTVATTSTTGGSTGTTATTRKPNEPECGAGSATASAKIKVDVTGSTDPPTYTYSGPVTVNNQTTKAIQIDSLVVRITSKDGTVEDEPVSAAINSVVDAGASRDFAFTYTSDHPDKPDGISLVKFAYRAPGASHSCASS
jgi:hypothetical protein